MNCIAVRKNHPMRVVAGGWCFWGALSVLAMLAGCTPKTSHGDEHEGDVQPIRQAADVPAPRVIEQPWMSIGEWRARHQRGLQAPNRATATWVVLGDSIAEAWVKDADFVDRFGDRDVLGLGVGGDQTQHVLWRINDGALTGVNPKLVLILIGINNLGNGYSPTETVRGVRAVVGAVQQRLPGSVILLLRIFPSGERPDAPIRGQIHEVNEALSQMEVPGSVVVADLSSALLEPDGRISPDTMADFLHPTAAGYRRLNRALEVTVAGLEPEAAADSAPGY